MVNGCSINGILERMWMVYTDLTGYFDGLKVVWAGCQLVKVTRAMLLSWYLARTEKEFNQTCFHLIEVCRDISTGKCCQFARFHPEW